MHSCQCSLDSPSHCTIHGSCAQSFLHLSWPVGSLLFPSGHRCKKSQDMVASSSRKMWERLYSQRNLGYFLKGRNEHQKILAGSECWIQSSIVYHTVDNQMLLGREATQAESEGSSPAHCCLAQQLATSGCNQLSILNASWAGKWHIDLGKGCLLSDQCQFYSVSNLFVCLQLDVICLPFFPIWGAQGRSQHLKYNTQYMLYNII